MSKEIYKEYVNRYFFGDCKNESQLESLNSEYLFLWDNNHGKIKGDTYLKNKGFNAYDFIELKETEFKYISLAPKMHNINGYEVIAPRYDEPKSKSTIFYLDFDENNGVCEDGYNAMINRNILVFGWFDNEQDAVLYANAHKESK